MKNNKIEHEDITNKTIYYSNLVQEPLIEELKYRYKLGMFSVEYCSQCGEQKTFKVKRNHNNVEGYFECTKCINQKWEYSASGWII